MSTTETALRDRLRLAEQQADHYAAAVDSLAKRLAEALRRLAPHDPDFVRLEAPDLVAEAAPDLQTGSFEERSRGLHTIDKRSP